MKQMPVPWVITRVDGGAAVEIQWEEHGHIARYEARYLRLECRCAACVEEMSRRSLLDPESVPADIRALAIRLVGQYAVHFTWSDGHATGIYPYERLLEICPCERCRGGAVPPGER